MRATAALLLLVVASAVADTLHVIPLRHRPADEILPIVRPLLRPSEGLSGSGFQLFLRADAPRAREVERIVASLDVARRQLRITVKQTVASDTDSTRAGVSGEVGNDDVRVRLPRGRDDRRGGKAARDGVQIEADQTTTRARNEQTQFISTLDGNRAFVRVGQSVPHVTRVLTLTGREALITQGVTLQNVVTGFDVLPQTQGERIRLEITPRLARLENPATGLVSFQEYSTTVVVKPGEWVDIGGLSGAGDEVRRAILDSNATQTGERRTILLKVE